MNRNLAVVLALLSFVFVPSVGAADSVWMKAANQHELDPVVLYALALQESRRLRPDGKVRPWPWTLHAKGHGAMYFDSYDEALDKLVELIDGRPELFQRLPFELCHRLLRRHAALLLYIN